jgi:polysaccharide biosynthesis/export protein
MKKFLFAAAFALVFCAHASRAASFQTDGVRVGPSSEEKTGEGSDAGATPAASKKDDKRAAPADDKNKARLIGASKASDGEKKKDGEAKEASGADEKDKSAAALSSATTVKPVGEKVSSTSDAPTKPGSPSPVPVNTPAKSAPTESSETKNASGANKTSGETKKTNPPAASPNASGATSDPNSAPSNTTTSTPTNPSVTPTNPSGVSTNPSGANANPSVPPPTASSSTAPAVPLTSVYRIGAGDVLDIRLLNAADPRASTLYTVLAGGALDYPLLKDPITVAGMTTDELAAQLIAELRHRGVYDRPQVRVGVREYVSHAVLVSGLVGDPGTKILRREAIPLYVVVAEAQPKPEAGRAVVISHATGKSTTVDLNDAPALNALVQAGDVVNVTVRPPEFFYIGGEINAPGQKDFHAGMTLTQAVLASGGTTRFAGGKVKVLRQGDDGRLVTTEYSLKQIESGKIPDPVLQPGDRLDIGRAGW